MLNRQISATVVTTDMVAFQRIHDIVDTRFRNVR
jgi:hypothetical protein